MMSLMHEQARHNSNAMQQAAKRPRVDPARERVIREGVAAALSVTPASASAQIAPALLPPSGQVLGGGGLLRGAAAPGGSAPAGAGGAEEGGAPLAGGLLAPVWSGIGLPPLLEAHRSGLAGGDACADACADDGAGLPRPRKMLNETMREARALQSGGLSMSGSSWGLATFKKGI